LQEALMISRRSFIGAAMATCATACAPLKEAALLFPGALSLNGSTMVAFRLAGGHIFIKAEIGRRPFSFIFDTGGAAVLSPEAQKILNYWVVGSVKVVGVGDEERDAPLVRVPTLGVAEAAYDNGTFIVLSLPFASDNPWPDIPFGGMIGREFLKGLVITVDYEKSTLALCEPAVFTADARATAFSLRERDGNPNIDAAVDGRSGSFDIDTGAALGLYLTSHFARDTDMRQSFARSTAGVLGHGLTGVTIGTLARAKTFAIGNFTVPAPVVGIPDADVGALAASGLDGNIGTDILRRFTVTFDMPHGKLYLLANAHMSDVFGCNRAGIFTERASGNVERVVFVAPASPASTAGIAANDTIVEIDGQATSLLTHDQVSAIWRRPAAMSINLRVVRGATVRSASLALRDMI
jgi:hypothetical protein